MASSFFSIEVHIGLNPTVTLIGVGVYKGIGKQIRRLGVQSLSYARIEASSSPVFSIRWSKESIVIARSSHPTNNNVHEPLDSDKQNGSHLSVSLSGASTHDRGKGIGTVTTNGDIIRGDEGERQPLYCVAL
jgi:hypothetical protein